MRTILVATAVMILMASAAVAATPAKYAEWAEGPVKHLMTGAEKAAWNAIGTEKEADAFVALFWAKRDPTPGTPANELKDEFDRRVALSDQFFTTKRTRGAMTDRGRVLILLGPPFDQGAQGPAARAPRNQELSTVDGWDGAVRGPRGESAKLTWTYAQDKKPKFINRKEFEIWFVDDQGDGQFQIAKSPRMDPEAVLQEAIQSLIFAPDLTVAPVYQIATVAAAVPSSFRTMGLKEACDQFRAEGKTSEGPAKLTWGQFVTPEGEVFVPVQMMLPAGSGIDAGRKVTFFGLVENEAGEIVSVHEDELTLAKSGRDAYVDKSLLLAPGTYKGTFGLAENGKVVAITRTDMKVEALDPTVPAISDLILSNNAYPLAEAQKMTDPFAFGGFKVVPKSDGLFSTSDEITYFYELRNPGLSDTGAPKVQAKILIEGTTAENKPVKMNFPIQEFPAIPLPGVKNHFGLAMTFAGKDFKPGKYTVKIKVIDTVLKQSYESEKPFQIQG